jgi:hypothetical protein
MEDTHFYQKPDMMSNKTAACTRIFLNKSRENRFGAGPLDRMYQKK